MTAPGWYGEPGNSAMERFWDGQQWTPQTRPTPKDAETSLNLGPNRYEVAFAGRGVAVGKCSHFGCADEVAAGAAHCFHHLTLAEQATVYAAQSARTAMPAAPSINRAGVDAARARINAERTICVNPGCREQRFMSQAFCERHLVVMIGQGRVDSLKAGHEAVVRTQVRADIVQKRADRINRVSDSLEQAARRPGDVSIVCPHCQTKGRVTSRHVKQKKGISGGKATGALLTGGISMLATGLSRKEKGTELRCHNCNTTWYV